MNANTYKLTTTSHHHRGLNDCQWYARLVLLGLGLEHPKTFTDGQEVLLVAMIGIAILATLKLVGDILKGDEKK